MKIVTSVLQLRIELQTYIANRTGTDTQCECVCPLRQKNFLVWLLHKQL